MEKKAARKEKKGALETEPERYAKAPRG